MSRPNASTGSGERAEPWRHEQGGTIAGDARRVSEHCGCTWPRRILREVRSPLPAAMLPVQEAVRPTDEGTHDHEVRIVPQGQAHKRRLGLGGGFGRFAGPRKAGVTVNCLAAQSMISEESESSRA